MFKRHFEEQFLTTPDVTTRLYKGLNGLQHPDRDVPDRSPAPGRAAAGRRAVGTRLDRRRSRNRPGLPARLGDEVADAARHAFVDGLHSALLCSTGLARLTGLRTLRIATEDVDLPGGTVHKGQAVMPTMWAANRDPAVFTDPERFDIDRPACPHLGFGQGQHFCLGAHLARQELRVALGTLLRRFPGLRLATEPASVPWTDNMVISRPKELPITW